jgi:hypothetical protein
MDLKRKKEHGIYSSKCVAQRNVSGSPFFLNVDAYVSFSKKKNCTCRDVFRFKKNCRCRCQTAYLVEMFMTSSKCADVQVMFFSIQMELFSLKLL